MSETDKCTICNVICTEEEATQGKCLVIGNKKICGNCVGHIKAALGSTGHN